MDVHRIEVLHSLTMTLAYDCWFIIKSYAKMLPNYLYCKTSVVVIQLLLIACLKAVLQFSLDSIFIAAEGSLAYL